MSPQSFKHFRVLELLGKGGMGEVYLALDTTLERKVALKFLPRELLRDPSAQGRLLDEARSVSRVQHPNIAVVHSIEEDGGIFAICMEYVEGATLKQLLHRGPVPLNQITRIGAETAAGMQAAHEKGIVHRDLKPANIMITRRGQVKIMDFGLALRPERVVTTLGPNTYGTVQYMSPEQARGETLTPASDIFSFGSTFYELIAGRPPFAGPNDLAILQSIIRTEPHPMREHRREVPPALEQIVRGCMAKVPQARWESMAAIAEEFRYLEPTVEAGPRDLISELSTGLAEPSQRLHHAPDNHGRVGRRSATPSGRGGSSGPTDPDRAGIEVPAGFVVHEVHEPASAHGARRSGNSRRKSVERTGEIAPRTGISRPPSVLGPQLPPDRAHPSEHFVQSTADLESSVLGDEASRQAAIAAEAARRGHRSRPVSPISSELAAGPRPLPRPGPFRDLQDEAEHLIAIGRRHRHERGGTQWTATIVPLLLAIAVLVAVGFALLRRAGVEPQLPNARQLEAGAAPRRSIETRALSDSTEAGATVDAMFNREG